MPATAAEKPVTIRVAADLASVSRRTIYLWLNAGKLRYTRTIGGGIRIYPSSLFVTAVDEAEAEIADTGASR